MPYHYTAYGLAIASEVECPELLAPESLASAPPGRADVTITLADIPARIDHPRHVTPRVQIGDGLFQLELEGVARYRAVAGREILVAPSPGAAAEDLRLFLLGTVFGALLHQMGRLPLHAAAVEADGRAWAFCGRSGAGKSTLSAALNRFGYPLLCDDVGVVVPGEDGTPLFYPGFPRIKLWRDALEHFDIDPGELTRDWSRADKYHLHLHDTFHHRPLPLGGVYFLERGDDDAPPAFQPLKPAEGVQLLMRDIYRRRIARRAGDTQLLFQRCAGLADRVPLRRFLRPWALARLDESLRALADDLARLER